MSTTQPLQLSQASSSELIFPSGEPYSDEPQLENYLHLKQIILLLTSLEWLWQDRNDFFAAGNLTIYYSEQQKKSEEFRGPDFFVVLDTQRRSRRSWCVWEENNKYPNVIVEILSDSTAKVDRGEKKRIYQDTFRLPDYFWFDPETLEFEGFTLVKGKYKPIKPTRQGWRRSEQLGLYLGIHEEKLRYYTAEGELVPTPEEAAILEKQQKELAQQQLDAERQQKELERQQKELERQQKELERQQKELAQQQLDAERQQVEQLKAQLRALGVEPEQ